MGTGIVYLPFLGILIDNWREPAQGGEVGHASGLSLRRMEIDLFMALLVVVLAGQPAALAPLNAGTLSYAPPPTLLEATPATATSRETPKVPTVPPDSRAHPPPSTFRSGGMPSWP